jgi:hypothetical protein
MAYPESCFTGLIGIHGTCEPQAAMYWFDDIPGIDLAKLAQVAEAGAPTGEKLGMKLIESAARLMAADVEAIYDGQYKVTNSLVNGCSTCRFTGNYAAGPNNGIVIKNNADSMISQLLVDKLTVKVNSTGTYNLVLDDGTTEGQRVIPFDFEAGNEYEFTGLNYRTKSKTVKVYFQEADVLLSILSCPRSGSGCGCSGASKSVISDLQYTGMTNGLETQNAYGFIACAGVTCDAADLLCYVANSAPRMIGMALLYKSAELYFSTRLQSARNNKIVGTNTDDAKDDAAKYAKLYKEKLNGTGTRGVKDLVYTTLQNSGDVCVVCNAMLASAWATT